MHFAVLPPEVNSGRMYAGPRVGPMLTAASAWEELANELHSSAEDFESVISGPTSDPWQGPPLRRRPRPAPRSMPRLPPTSRRIR